LQPNNFVLPAAEGTVQVTAGRGLPAHQMQLLAILNGTVTVNGPPVSTFIASSSAKSIDHVHRNSQRTVGPTQCLIPSGRIFRISISAIKTFRHLDCGPGQMHCSCGCLESTAQLWCHGRQFTLLATSTILIQVSRILYTSVIPAPPRQPHRAVFSRHR